MSQHEHNDIENLNVTRRERLIARLVDGEAADAEWAEFCRLADADSAGRGESALAWRELAQAQREHALLTGAVGREVNLAELVELPVQAERFVGLGFGPRPRTHAQGGGPVVRRLVTWGGWTAVAATLVLAWLNGTFARPFMKPGVDSTASFIPEGFVHIASEDDALNEYLKRGEASGRVLGEIPRRVLIDSKPKPGGNGYEVVYLRQFLERAELSDLYQVSRDEGGQPVLMQVSNTGQPGRVH